MPLYSYTKSHGKSRGKKIISFISAILILTGLAVVGWTVYPIATYEIFYAPKFENSVNPVPMEIVKNTIADNIPAVLGAQNADYTRASAWFPKANNIKLSNSNTSYFVSIPKVNIQNATVLLGNDDLNKSLVQFAGPLPGNYGNPVIFGHSTLLWFYNPKDYRTIFSELPQLNIGDDIYISLENISYHYKVFQMKVVWPDNLSVLDQTYDDEYLTLITCVPPGTFYKRLVVSARLVR